MQIVVTVVVEGNLILQVHHGTNLSRLPHNPQANLCLKAAQKQCIEYPLDFYYYSFKIVVVVDCWFYYVYQEHCRLYTCRSKGSTSMNRKRSVSNRPPQTRRERFVQLNGQRNQVAAVAAHL